MSTMTTTTTNHQLSLYRVKGEQLSTPYYHPRIHADTDRKAIIYPDSVYRYRIELDSVYRYRIELDSVYRSRKYRSNSITFIDVGSKFNSVHRYYIGSNSIPFIDLIPNSIPFIHVSNSILFINIVSTSMPSYPTDVVPFIDSPSYPIDSVFEYTIMCSTRSRLSPSYASNSTPFIDIVPISNSHLSIRYRIELDSVYRYHIELD